MELAIARLLIEPLGIVFHVTSALQHRGWSRPPVGAWIETPAVNTPHKLM